MNSPSRDLAAYIVSQGIGTFKATSGWRVSSGREPESPNTTITLYDLPGNAAFADEQLYEVSVQVRVRSHSYEAAYAKHEDIRDLFILPKEVTLGDGTARYIGMWLQTDINSLGTDDNNRFLLVATYRIQRQPTEAS